MRLFNAVYRAAVLLARQIKKRRQLSLGVRDLREDLLQSADQLEARRGELLKQMLVHAHTNCPFWRKRLDESGLVGGQITSIEDLQRLPILEKADVRANLESMSAQNLADSRLPATTGGSTAAPMQFYRDPKCCNFREAVCAVYWRQIGKTLQDRWVNIWGAMADLGDPSTIRSRIRARLLNRVIIIPANRLDSASVERFVAEINSFQPVLLHGYSQAIYLFTRLLEEQGLALPESVTSVTVTAEPLYDSQKEYIERILQLPVYRVYGTREFGFIGGELPGSSGLQLNPLNSIVEIIGPDGEPVSKPGERGQIVVTDLHNMATPLIRYRIGDVGSWQNAGFPDGQWQSLEIDAGRETDFIVAGDGHLIGGAGLTLINSPGINQLQYVQKQAGEIQVNFVGNAEFQDQDLDSIRHQLETVVGDLNVRFQEVAADYNYAIGKIPVRLLGGQPENARSIRGEFGEIPLSSDNSHDARSVLWLSFPFPPAMSAGVFRTIRFIRYLPDSGWRPVVYTCQPDEFASVDNQLLDYLPDEMIVEEGKIWRLEQRISRLWRRPDSKKRVEPGPQVRASEGPGNATPNNNGPRHTPGKTRKLRKTISQRVFATPDPQIWWAIPSFLPALRFARKHSPQLIFSTGPPHSSHLLGLWLKRWTGLPLVLDFRDPWSRSPWLNNRNDYLARVHRRLERKCVAAADAVILNTPEARRDFLEFYGPGHAHKFHTIYNGYDPLMRARVDRLNDSETIPRQAGRLKICHVGSLYGRREIRPLLRAIARVAARGVDIHFEQIGRVKLDFDIEEFVQQKGLEKHVHVSPPVKHAEALACMARADALLLIQPDGKFQVPGKLFEMILFRKPILGLTSEGATLDIVRQYNLGPVANPLDENEIADALESLSQSPDSTPFANWDAVYAAFDGRRQSEQLAGIFDTVVPSGEQVAAKIGST